MSWGQHTYTLLDRIEEIETALNEKLWQSALSLALTIPDICGQIEFKKYIKKNRDGSSVRLVGKQYKEWFTKHVEYHYAETQSSYFNAEMCYQLRNAFLHSGSDDVRQTNFKFELRTSSTDCISYNNCEIIHISLDISRLCSFLCMEGKSFYSTWENKDDFNDSKCNWLDVKEFSECYETANRGGEE